MKLLTAVNGILKALGESEVESLSSSNPTLGLAVAALNEQQINLLARGWYFNTRTISTVPLDGFIDVPNQALQVYGITGMYTIRNRQLFDLINYTSVFPKDKEVAFHVTLNLDFEELPECVAAYIMYKAAAQVYSNDLGVDNNAQMLELRAQEEYQRLYSDELRMRKINLTRRNTPYRRVLAVMNL